MQVARRFEWPPVVVVSISLHFFWLLLLLLCLGRERDEIRYGLGMSPLHSNTGVRQPNTHQKYQVRFQRAQGNKIKKKKRKLCLASVIDTTDTSEWKKGRGRPAAAAAEGFTDDIVRTPHKRTDNRYTGAPEICDGGRPSVGRARVRSAQQRRFETDDYGME